MDEARLAAYAFERHGVIDSDALQRFGISPATARARVRRGQWRQLHPGIYISASTPVRFETRVHAALVALPTAVLSDDCARWLHRLRDDDSPDVPVRVQLTVPPGGRNRLAATTVHQRNLDPSEVTSRRSWTVTTVERTIMDLAGTRRPAATQALVENALIDRMTTPERLAELVGRHAARGRSGPSRLRSVLDTLSTSIPESALERAFLRWLTRVGLPKPDGQTRFDWLGAERCRVDFWYPSAALIVEVDGRSFHTRTDAFESDRRRELLAIAHGCATIRVGYAQLCASSTELYEALSVALRSENANRGL